MRINIEVVYASESKQRLKNISIDENATVLECIQASNLLIEFPEIDLTKQQVGIYSKKVNLDDSVKEGDRIEIYRPLIIDPMTARRKRSQ